MDTRSRHMMVDLWLDEPVTDTLVRALLDRARSHLTVLDELDYAFEPQGQTILFVLSESHFSLHTYPEHRYLSLDIYVCNPSVDVEAIADALAAPLRLRDQVRQLVWRGIPSS